MTSIDPFHFHQWIPGMTGSDFCRVCHKTKDQLAAERLSETEEKIDQLTINIQHLAYEFEKTKQAFNAFVDLVIAYAKGSAEDLTTFKEATEGVADEDQSTDG